MTRASPTTSWRWADEPAKPPDYDRPLADAIPVFSAMTGFALPFDISGQPAVPVLAPDGKDGFTPSWCRWANDERLVCSFRGIERDKYLGNAAASGVSTATIACAGKPLAGVRARIAPGASARLRASL